MPTDLTREFLQQVVRGSGWSLSEVESLSLEGEGISSLGDSFGGATRLVYLNLARNDLSSLLGVEHLASLATLVLRENRVEAMSEVGRLADLSSLRDLDLRLNPIMTAAVTYFVGEGGRSLSGSMSGSGGGGGGGRSGGNGGSGNRRADVLRVLPQLAGLNGRRVVDDERPPRYGYGQRHRGERAENPPRQRRTRQHYPGHQQPQQREQQRRPQGSVAPPSARPAADRLPTNGTNEENSAAAWDAGLGLGMSGGSGRSRRECFSSASGATAATAASSRHRHREQHLPRQAPRPQGGGGDGDDGAEEDEFARFFTAAGEARGAAPPPSNHGDGGSAVAAGGAGDTSPRVLRSSVSPRLRDGGVVRGFERFVDHGGRGVAPGEGRGRDGHRCRQPGGSRAMATELEGTAAEGAAAAAATAARRKRDRPGVGDVGRSSCSLDAGALLPELRREDRRGGGFGGYGGKASAVEAHGRDPDRPAAGVGRGAAAAFHDGQADRDRRAITPPQAVALAPPAAGGGGGDGDDLATLWLELGTDESLDSGRRPSLPSSLSTSAADAAVAATTTTTVSAAAKAVEAFRRSTQRLGLPPAAPADGDRGGDGGNARDGLDADNHGDGAPCSPRECVSSALGESSLATVPVEAMTAALATTTLAKAAAPSEGAVVPNPEPGSGCVDNCIALRCTACGGSGKIVERRRPDGSAITAGKSEAAPAAAAAAAEVVTAWGWVFSSACDAREMDERWWAREREFTERWAAREREFDKRWAARDREFDKRRREEAKEFTAEMRSMLLGAHEALISSNAWLVERLKTVEAAAAVAAAAKKSGPYSERSPYGTASGPGESGTSLVLGSKQAVPSRVAAVNGADIGPSAATAPGSVERGAVRGTEPPGDGGRRSEAGDHCRVGGVSQEEVLPPRETDRQAEEGKTGHLAKDQTMRKTTGVKSDAESTAAVAVGAAHRAGVTPPPGDEVGREGKGAAVGAAAAPGVAPLSYSWGGGHSVVASVGRPAVKVAPPGTSSERAAVVVAASSAPMVADVGAGAAAVAPRHTEQAADGNGGGSGSGGEDIVGSSREGGMFGGDPEVTVSAALGV